MNAHEGLTRIAKVTRIIGAGIAVAFACGSLVALFTMKSDAFFMFLMCNLIGAFFYGCAFAIAWIIDGFAKPKPQQNN